MRTTAFIAVLVVTVQVALPASSAVKDPFVPAGYPLRVSCVGSCEDDEFAETGLPLDADDWRCTANSSNRAAR